MKQSLDAILTPYLDRIDREFRNFAPFPTFAALRDPISYFFTLPGKRVRPLITLITAEHFCHDYEGIIPAAVAIEVLHDFTLVHDDIMDDDHFRRGCETVHTKWDIGTAILSGDAMVALAYQKLLQARSPHLIKMIEAFTDGMYEVCEGQARDKEFETRDDVSLDEYLPMISQKTARLFALAFELGYLSCSCDSDMLGALKQMGEQIGLAFQVRDDLLDFVADQEALGKDIGSDWRRRKKTYITIRYRQKTETNQQLPQDLFALREFSAARDAIAQAGILDEAQQFIQERLDEAEAIAASINFAHPVLHHLLKFLAKRSS
ncbi:MAG: polyprenyl synthetase family protein [Deltaproteobacteria bacterium]|nr:polyprenyl synthetase family protein [Deltaproteobacteria bacterium]